MGERGGGNTRRSPDPASQTVSHYEILGEIGGGGMGLVYRARDLQAGRMVALKRPRPELADDPIIRKRFRTEARAAATILHPHVVTVFEVFEAGGSDWMAMELIEGEALSALLHRRGALPVEEILSHAEGIADALRAGHAKGIVHRDVSPKNILIDGESRARLTDFGLARILRNPDGSVSSATTASLVTEAGQVLGTPVYMSPEQALGRPVDSRSDVYSLGAVIYEMCTGRAVVPPGPAGEILDAILHREPPSIARSNYAIPDDLERIVRKCLAKRPDERYQDVRELLVDLRTLHRKIDGRSTESARTLRTWWVAGSVVAVGAAVALGLLVAPRPEARRDLGRARQITAAPGWEAESAISPDGGFIAYVSNESGPPDLWLVDVHGGDPLRLVSDPDPQRSPAWLADGSAIVFVTERGGNASIWKVPRLGGSATLLIDDGLDPAPSPDGRSIAFARPDAKGNARIALAPLSDLSAARTLTGDDDGVFDHRQPAWSPDGTRLCYSDQKDLWVVPARGGPARRLTSDGVGDMEPTWSSDGSEVIFASYREGTLALWRVSASGGPAARVTLGTGPERRPSVSRDGTRLAYSTFAEDPDLLVADLVTGDQWRLASLGVEYNMTMAPDAARVVFVSNRWGSYGLWEQSLAAGGPRGTPRKLTDHPGYAVNPAISPDGRWIAYQRLLDEERDIWILASRGGNPQRFTDHPGIDIQPAWSPDGSHLAFVSDREDGRHVWVQPVRDGKPAGAARRLTRGAREDNAPTWSHDGRRIAYVGVDQRESEVYVIPVDGSSDSVRVPTGSGPHRVRWDGRTGMLLVSGSWGGNVLQIRRVPLSGAPGTPLDRPIDFGPMATIGDFDVSADGRFLVYARQEVRGDVWLMESKQGSF